MKTDVFFAAMLAASLFAQSRRSVRLPSGPVVVPNQDGISTEGTKLDWDAGGPKIVWKVPMNFRVKLLFD